MAGAPPENLIQGFYRAQSFGKKGPVVSWLKCGHFFSTVKIRELQDAVKGVALGVMSISASCRRNMGGKVMQISYVR